MLMSSIAPASTVRKIDVTVVVCTRNRVRQLETCLHSISCAIKHQDKEIEVVIVDNGSNDNTRQVAHSWVSTRSFPAQVVCEDRPGLAVARNTAVRKAKGDLIVFTDDDCTLAPAYFQKMGLHFAADSSPVIRGGRVELGNLMDLDFTTKHSLEISRLEDVACVAGFILGCNMIFPRKIFASIGYFDERFGAGGLFRSGEETDLICRAYLAGIPIEYVPDMVVQHHHGRQNPHEIRKLHFDYCIGKGALYSKYCYSGPRLLRHLYWDSRKTIFEMLGGGTINREFGLTYRETLAANLLGMSLYALNRADELTHSILAAINRTARCLLLRTIEDSWPKR